MPRTIPSVKEPIADQRGAINPSWYRFLVQFRTDFTALGSHPLSIVGRPDSGNASPQDILASSDGQVLQRDGTSVAFRYPKLPSFTVATLPSAATQGAGTRLFVTDANATTFNSVVAGGGTNKVPVFSDGSNWRIG